MPLDLEEKRARDVPVNSTLLVKVVTGSPGVNATGRLDAPDDSSQNLTHQAIVGATKKLRLSATGIYIARVNLILNDEKTQTATVEYSIESDGKEIRTFKPTFSGKS